MLIFYSGADTRASDKSGMNPFMIAVEKNNLEVVTAMMDKDPGLMLFQIGSGSRVFHWALEKGHQRNAFFKVCFFILLIFFYQLEYPLRRAYEVYC